MRPPSGQSCSCLWPWRIKHPPGEGFPGLPGRPEGVKLSAANLSPQHTGVPSPLPRPGWVGSVAIVGAGYSKGGVIISTVIEIGARCMSLCNAHGQSAAWVLGRRLISLVASWSSVTHPQRQVVTTAKSGALTTAKEKRLRSMQAFEAVPYSPLCWMEGGDLAVRTKGRREEWKGRSNPR